MNYFATFLDPQAEATTSQNPPSAPEMTLNGASIKIWMVAAVGFIIFLWFAPQIWRGVDDAYHEHVSLWNWGVETIEVGLGIVLLKLLANWRPVNGLTQIVNTM